MTYEIWTHLSTRVFYTDDRMIALRLAARLDGYVLARVFGELVPVAG